MPLALWAWMDRGRSSGGPKQLGMGVADAANRGFLFSAQRHRRDHWKEEFSHNASQGGRSFTGDGRSSSSVLTPPRSHKSSSITAARHNDADDCPWTSAWKSSGLPIEEGQLHVPNVSQRSLAHPQPLVNCTKRILRPALCHATSITYQSINLATHRLLLQWVRARRRRRRTSTSCNDDWIVARLATVLQSMAGLVVLCGRGFED